MPEDEMPGRTNDSIKSTDNLHFHPVTPDRWGDLEALFGPRGACAGCWCMYWRQTRSEFEQLRGEQNRMALKALVDAGEIPGILAYSGHGPVGWVSVAPRETFAALKRSRVLKPVDDQPVWSVVCFFVAKGFRRQGLTVELLKAAGDYAKQRGARILEDKVRLAGGDIKIALAMYKGGADNQTAQRYADHTLGVYERLRKKKLGRK